MLNSCNVQVYCYHCNHIFWEGNLIQWACELEKKKSPKWFANCLNHKKRLHHKILVKYPSQTVDLFDLKKEN